MQVIYNQNAYTLLDDTYVVYRYFFDEFKFKSMYICDGSQYVDCKLYIENDTLILKEFSIEYGEENEQYPTIDNVLPTIISRHFNPILNYKNLSRKFDVSGKITFGTNFLASANEQYYKKYLETHRSRVMTNSLFWHTNKIWYDKVYEAHITNGKIINIIDITKSVKAERKAQLGQHVSTANPTIRKMALLSKKWIMKNKDKVTQGTEEERKYDAKIHLLIKMQHMYPNVNTNDEILVKIANLSLKWCNKYKKCKSEEGEKIPTKRLWCQLWHQLPFLGNMHAVLEYYIFKKYL